jgi:hypothetical protein
VIDTPAAPLEGAVCAVHADRAASFVCQRCGSYACPDCAVDETRTQCRACGAGLVDWERWRELGLFATFFSTTRELLFAPAAFFRKAPGPRAGPPFAYGVVAFMLAQLAYAVVFALFMVVVGFRGSSFGGAPEKLGELLAMAVCIAPMICIQAPIQSGIAIVWSAGWAHLTLHLMGKTSATFEQSMRATSYANAPYVLWFVPCVGWIASFVWVPILEAIAMRETHRVSMGTALFAVLAHRAALILGVALLYAFLFAFAFASTPGFGAPR